MSRPGWRPVCIDGSYFFSIFLLRIFKFSLNIFCIVFFKHFFMVNLTDELEINGKPVLFDENKRLQNLQNQ